MRVLRPLLTALLLAAPFPALASPITFGLDHGSTTARVSVNGFVIGTAAGKLDSGFVVLDPSTGTLPSFDLGASGLVVTSSYLPGGYDTIDLSVELTPGTGYASSATGSNPWSITLGPVNVSFVGSVLDTTPGGQPPIPISGVLPVSSFAVTAVFDAGQMRLGLFGLKIGELRFQGVVYDVRADIEFVGFAVPEPAAAGLAFAGLGALAALRRRARR
jgi:hypothetical protein